MHYPSQGNTGLKCDLAPWKCNLCYAVLSLLLVVGFTVTLALFLWPGKVEEDSVPSLKYTDILVTRGLWLARPQGECVQKFKVQPVDMVIVGHTAGSNCSLMSHCEVAVRTLQAQAIDMGWSDIGYNFLIGGDGYIYEGRGWDQEGVHTFKYNHMSIGVGFIGDFIRDAPPQRQLRAFKILLEEGVNLGKLTTNYKMLLQKQLKATESPGAVLSEILKKWNHWSFEIPLLKQHRSVTCD